MSAPSRVLLTGWFGFLHGEATAGDVLAAEAVARALAAAGIPCDTAWSPGFRPDALHLSGADPACYSHLVFACGPVHSRPAGPGGPTPLLDLHRRFAGCRRVAVGVSVPDPLDPAVTGFHRIIPRDGARPSAGRAAEPAARPAVDLAALAPRPSAVPVVAVLLTEGQGEYGGRRRHGEAARLLTAWLHGMDVARLSLDTRLDSRDWRLAATAGQLCSVLGRCDVVVTTRLHGLVLGLRAGVPVIAVDPVAGGAKVTAQAAALDWPALVPADRLGERERAAGELAAWWQWCLSPEARTRAARCGDLPPAGRGPDLLAELLAELTGPA